MMQYMTPNEDSYIMVGPNTRAYNPAALMLLLYIISIVALAIGSTALYKVMTPANKVVVLGKAEDPLPPWITWTPSTFMERGSCTLSSNNSAGAVQGVISTLGQYMIEVHFGQGFPETPKSVAVTSAQAPEPNSLAFGLWAHNLNDEGFTVGGWFQATEGPLPQVLFYYQVV